jgi:hypothetical protein
VLAMAGRSVVEPSRPALGAEERAMAAVEEAPMMAEKE